jgi:hypothetical protein
VPPDEILALIPDFVRRYRLAPIGGTTERPIGYFTGKPVLRTETIQDALAALSHAGCRFFAADRVLVLGAARDGMIVRRFHPGPSALLRRAYGHGHALLDALADAGIPNAALLDGDTTSSHRRLHLEALLAAAPTAARAAWADIVETRAARPLPPRPLRFHRQGAFRWIAEEGQSMPWILREAVPETRA